MKTFILFCSILIGWTIQAFSQVGVSSDGSQPDPTAMLDIKSTTRGALLPRMTTAQIIAISNPADGLMAYNIDDGKLYLYVATAQVWKELSYGPGTIASFICGNNFVDQRDSKTYQTVLIGTQCWMKENLNYGTMVMGNQEQSDNNIPEKYCYSDFPPLCDTYGGLYQWAELVQYLNGASNTSSWDPVPTGNIQGLCPPDWHIPTDADWITLSTFLGGEAVSGGPLKEAGYDHWMFPNAGATNSTDFTGLPGGDRHSDWNFYNINWMAWFWTASEAYPAVGWYYSLDASFANLNRSIFDKANGFSVRCLHN